VGKKPNGRFRLKFVALEEAVNEAWTLPGGRDQKSDNTSGHFENKIRVILKRRMKCDIY
jgi:hypothetical protein